MWAGFIPRYLSAMRTYHLPLREIREVQNRKLRATIRHAFTYVPFYRRVFRERGWTPEDFRTIDDLRKIPILTKADLAKNQPDGLMARGMKSEFSRITTGTTATPVRVAFSREFLDAKAALMLRRFVNFGIRPWHRIVTIWDPLWRWRKREINGKPRRTTQLLEMPLATVFGRPMPQIKVVQGGTGDISQEARRLAEFNPDFVFCRPTHLWRIADSLAQQGLSVRPKAIVSTNEVLTDTCATQLERAFGAKTLRLFGGSEAGPMGEDCKFKSGVHLNEDHYVIEVLRDGEAVGEGEMGEVVVTHLHNPVMPLIRYRMGDFVEMGESGTCQCGSSLPRLKSIQGRINDRLVTSSGDRVAPLPVADFLEAQFGLRDFQIVQSEMSRFILRVSKDSLVTSSRIRGIQEYLGKIVGAPVLLSTEVRGDEEQWMKERPVLSKLE